ncbi:hypothetical protein [Actinoplanes sp. NPDC026623]|uniref:hypothetical protein n=1 Tax=Actinoplanes sp. NPDC026623 TaxID=3155610 RepID=UPI0033FF9C3F
MLAYRFAYRYHAQQGGRALARRCLAARPCRHLLAGLVRRQTVGPFARLTPLTFHENRSHHMKDRPRQRATLPNFATPQTGGHPGACGIVRPHHDQQPADADVCWDATLRRLRAAATEAGRSAVDWWEQDTIGGRATGDVRAIAGRVLAGIDDGDPAVLDLLPRLDLSGQRADGPIEADLYTAATGPADSTWSALGDSRRGEAIDVYRDAFDTAVLDRVTNLCRQTAEPAVRSKPGADPTATDRFERTENHHDQPDRRPVRRRR